MLITNADIGEFSKCRQVYVLTDADTGEFPKRRQVYVLFYVLVMPTPVSF